MTPPKSSEHVLRAIRSKTDVDQAIRDFLTDLICDERKHLGKVKPHYKDDYKKLMERHAKQWGKGHAD